MSAIDDSTADGPTPTIQVLFALHDLFSDPDYNGPREVFTSAHHKPHSPAFKCTIAAPTPSVKSSSGLVLEANIDYEKAQTELETYDILIVPGGNGIEEILTKASTTSPLSSSSSPSPLQELTALVKAFAELQVRNSSKERTLVGVSSGALLLAHAGLLQGMGATTHPDLYTKMELLCKEAARRGDLKQTDVMEENYVVNNARFELGEDLEENPFVLSKRPDARRKSVARKGSNAWKESVKRRESVARRAALRLGGLRVITSRGGDGGMDVGLYLVAAMVSHEVAEGIAESRGYRWEKGVTVEGIDV
ncbi:MAG: hypothetical protein Q9167_000794 [Letrouitia subvulpina]